MLTLRERFTFDRLVDHSANRSVFGQPCFTSIEDRLRECANRAKTGRALAKLVTLADFASRYPCWCDYCQSY